MSYHKLRQTFTGFFEKKDHLVLPSSSLIPAEDPTLLFTNAGMNQFKDMFLGVSAPPHKRIATIQRCVRAGGKHNDLENVGYTARHHTFFEMLGNFSFGDYFKEQAISWAYEFVTEVLNIPVAKLWITVHHSDEESFNIWTKHIGIAPNRVVRKGDKDNFWAMGDTGPCGPCTEIFYDHGPQVAGGPPGTPDEDGDRYMEIWNLVFMQYERLLDGRLQPLPQPCVDTGMGLERLACVVEGVFSNFDTSLFKELKKIFLGYCPQAPQHVLNVLADHLRSSVFILSDGVTPTADGRGYVLRRLIRRALRHAYQYGMKRPFLQETVPTLVHLMSEAYPQIAEKQNFCQQRLLAEQELFFHTLQGGQKYFEQALQQQSDIISGETLFKLYDTYGFPLDIAIDEAKSRHIPCDLAGYEVLMAKQKELSKPQSGQLALTASDMPEEKSVFLREHTTVDSVITAVYSDTKETCFLCFDKTVFYAESGGQLADHGHITIKEQHYDVIDAQKMLDHVIVKVAAPAESFYKGMVVRQYLNTQRRNNLCAHHTATHLLHAAIQHVIGAEVFQKGSLVAADRLRFDVAYDKPLTPAILHELETFCQRAIDEAHPVITKEMGKNEALSMGAMAFFEDKYGDVVRVVHIGEALSMELCGGTHVTNLSEIKAFVLLYDEALSAGVRRLHAICGTPALEYLKNQRTVLTQVEKQLRVSSADIIETLKAQQDQMLGLQKALKQQYQLWVQHQAMQAMPQQAVGPVLSLLLDEKYFNEAVVAADIWKQELPPHVLGLIMQQSAGEQKRFIIVASQKSSWQLNEFLKEAQTVWPQLKGGGRAHMVQAGGTGFEQKQIESTLAQWVESCLSR